MGVDPASGPTGFSSHTISNAWLSSSFLESFISPLAFDQDRAQSLVIGLSRAEEGFITIDGIQTLICKRPTYRGFGGSSLTLELHMPIPSERGHYLREEYGHMRCAQ
jgi:hypothetical protein